MCFYFIIFYKDPSCCLEFYICSFKTADKLNFRAGLLFLSAKQFYVPGCVLTRNYIITITTVSCAKRTESLLLTHRSDRVRCDAVVVALDLK